MEGRESCTGRTEFFYPGSLLRLCQSLNVDHCGLWTVTYDRRHHLLEGIRNANTQRKQANRIEAFGIWSDPKCSVSSAYSVWYEPKNGYVPWHGFENLSNTYNAGLFLDII